MGLNIPAGSRIAFDTPVLIYFLEHHPRFYQGTAPLRAHEGGDIHGVSLALTELLVPAFRVGQADKAQRSVDLLSGVSNLGDHGCHDANRCYGGTTARRI